MALAVSRSFRRVAETLQGSAEALELIGAARSVRRLRPSTVHQAIEFAERFQYARISIRPMQIQSEIRSFLILLTSDPPATVLEIGTGRGGTLFLLAQVARDDAVLVSLDSPDVIAGFGARPEYRDRGRLYRSLGRDHQRVVILAADSHLSGTRDDVRRILAGRPLDVLFIDGDHSTRGVEADFRMYSPLLRSGGLVAFHDIVPGPAGAVGGVPAFWEEVRTPECIEFVEDWQQGGYGIGVLRL
jgi:predicted O-methyltransferase YrrM